MKHKNHYGQGLDYVEEKQLRNCLLSLMNLNTGLTVDAFELLYIEQLEDRSYCVTVVDVDGEDDGEFFFDKAVTAIDFFIKMRREMSLGYDFEGHHPIETFLDNIKTTVNEDGTVTIEGKVPEEVFDNLVNIQIP